MKFFIAVTIFFILSACSNSPERETGEIKTINLITDALTQKRNPVKFLDARKILDRKQIDEAEIPVLFVELSSGQNGTLTPYPNQGVGQTWLGADGATLTFEQGVLKASRGMGDDVMGGQSSIPPWNKINETKRYQRTLSYLGGNNQIFSEILSCKIEKTSNGESLLVWGLVFSVNKFEENCTIGDFKIQNFYYVDSRSIVRKSIQRHSDTIGYITTERIDR